MPKPPRSSRGKSWRSGKEPQRRGRTGAAKPSVWAQKADKSYDRAKQRHRAKLVGWSLLFVVLIVSFVVWLFWVPKPTPFLIAAITAYEAPIPPNAFASEDVERLKTLHAQRVIGIETIPWSTKKLWMQRLREKLEAATPGGPDRNLVVIYLSMHGALDGDNEPCLLPPGAAPTDSKNWLRVRELFRYLFAKDRPNRQPDEVKKLVILDCNRMDVNWNLGLLYNDFAERLREVVDEVQTNVPSLVVLNSTGPGQIGWSAPELQASVFGLFLGQGLTGAADAEKSGNGDGRISLQELHQYLRAHVRQWVGATRVDVQDQGPMLLPENADFPLVFAKSDRGTQLPKPVQADLRWAAIDSLWQRHAELRETTPHRFHPLAWAEFEGKLMRLEQLVQSGKAYREEFAETRKQLQSLADTLQRTGTGHNLAAFSLALARQLDNWPSDVELEAARSHLISTLGSKAPASEAKPEAGASPDGSAEKDPPGEPGTAPAEAGEEPPDSYLAAAAAAWDWCRQNPLHHADSRRKVLDFVTKANPNGRVDVVEILFLRMLDAYLDRPAWQANPPFVRRALAARLSAEEAAAPADERAFYWTGESVDEAEELRRRAEDLLFVSAREQGIDEILTRIAGTDGNGGTYAEAIHRAQEVAEAFALRDRAWSEVPYLAQWQLARLHYAGEQASGLRSVIKHTHQLAALLDEAVAHGRWTPEIQETAAGLENGLEGLERAFAEECQRLEEAGADTQTLQALSSVLAVPLVTGSQRGELRQDYLTILGRIASAGKTYRVASAEDVSGHSPGRIPLDVAARQYLDRLKPWSDQHPVLAILSRKQFDGGPSAPALPALPTGPDPSKEFAADHDATMAAYEAQREYLAEQGEQVRQLLATVARESQRLAAATKSKLEDQEGSRKSPATVRAGCSQADRLVRAAAPILAAGPVDAVDADPAQLLRALDLHYLLLWQAERALNDFWGPDPHGQGHSYFSLVAAAYLKSARDLCRDDVGLLKAQEGVPALLVLRDKAAQEAVQPIKPKDLWVDAETRVVPHRFSVDMAGGLPPGKAALYLENRADGAGELLPLLQTPQHGAADLRRMAVEVPAADTAEAGTTDEFRVSIDDRVKEGNLHAVALYRGHLRRSPRFYVQAAGGSETEWVRPNYPPPTIVVYGQARLRTSLLFILDCSATMAEMVAIEGGAQISRLDVTCNALNEILARLIFPDDRYHVGLRTYGHRVGFNRSWEKIHWDPNRDRQKPVVLPSNHPSFTIHPSQDVELVLRPSRFSQSEFDFVKRKLETFRPLGQTPLCLAITQAIDDLRNAEGRRHIIAITDGLNMQESRRQDRVAKTIYRDVKTAMEKSGNEDVHLDIVGFAVESIREQLEKAKEGKAELTGSLEEFQRFIELLETRDRGGLYYADDPTSLLNALEKSLGLCQYVVKTVPAGRTVGYKPLELNAPCEKIPKPLDRAVPYLVAVTDAKRPATAEVVIEGGEALELHLQDDRQRDLRRLVFRRYDKDLGDSCDSVPATFGGHGGAIFVGAHMPDWEGGAAKFYLSVQNADPAQFSPRPAEVWIQVKPLLPDSDPRAGTSYTFFDATFYNSDYHSVAYPVPMLCCLAPAWPEAAKDAEIRFGCKFEKTRPDRVVTVSGFRQQAPAIPEAPGVTFEIETKRGDTSRDPFRVIVTERHPQGDPLEALKVAMWPTPERIVRRFIPKTGTVRHTFFYSDAAAPKIDTYRVEFTTRDNLLRGASVLPQPLKVRLARD